MAQRHSELLHFYGLFLFAGIPCAPPIAMRLHRGIGLVVSERIDNVPLAEELELLAALELTESVNGHHADYALGVRRVFFSAGKMATLDALMGGSEAEMAALADAARIARNLTRAVFTPRP